MCRDGMCGASDCRRCYPTFKRKERDPDEVYEERRQEELEAALERQEGRS